MFWPPVEPVPSFPLAPLPQHLTESSSRMAQKCASPPVIALAVRPEPKLMAVVGGASKSAVLPPFPSRPSARSPQHLTEPSSRRAQAVLKAVASETAVRPVPKEPRVEGVLVFEVEPIPSWPWSF